MLALMLAMVAWQPATAQDDNGPQVLRDTETELLFKQMSVPLMLPLPLPLPLQLQLPFNSPLSAP